MSSVLASSSMPGRPETPDITRQALSKNMSWEEELSREVAKSAFNFVAFSTHSPERRAAQNNIISYLNGRNVSQRIKVKDKICDLIEAFSIYCVRNGHTNNPKSQSEKETMKFAERNRHAINEHIFLAGIVPMDIHKLAVSKYRKSINNHKATAPNPTQDSSHPNLPNQPHPTGNDQENPQFNFANLSGVEQTQFSHGEFSASDAASNLPMPEFDFTAFENFPVSDAASNLPMPETSNLEAFDTLNSNFFQRDAISRPNTISTNPSPQYQDSNISNVLPELAPSQSASQRYSGSDLASRVGAWDLNSNAGSGLSTKRKRQDSPVNSDDGAAIQECSNNLDKLNLEPDVERAHKRIFTRVAKQISEVVADRSRETLADKNDVIQAILSLNDLGPQMNRAINGNTERALAKIFKQSE